MIKNIINEQKQMDITPDKVDNEILQELDEYLNSKFESERNDYEQIKSHSIPSPVLKENGLWQIPGTNKYFKTSEQAYKAINRYTEYLTQNEASVLMYGVDYNQYINGDVNNEEGRLSETETSESREGYNGPRDIPTDNTRNEPIPETPTDYTTNN